MANGSLTKKCEKQIESRAKRKLCHEMSNHYSDKICHLANQCYRREPPQVWPFASSNIQQESLLQAQ